MDKIHKIISLEQAKNRTPNALEYYTIDEETNTCVLRDDDETWGGYCVDILIPKTNDMCLPLLEWVEDLHELFGFKIVEIPVTTISNDGVPSECICEPQDVIEGYWARYKNLMLKYHWLLNELIPSIVFYMKCDEGFKKIKVDNPSAFFETTVNLVGNLSEIVYMQTGDIVGTTKLYDEFISKFVNLSNAKSFIGFMEKLLSEGLFQPLSGTTPYLDVEFSITSSQIDLGVMSPFVSAWIPKRRYYLGEMVFYNNDTYMLTRCDVGKYYKQEVTGELLDEILNAINSGEITRYFMVENLSDIPDSIYHLNVHGPEYISTYRQCVYKKTDSNNIVTYYLIYPYYDGEFNRITRVSSFDTTPKKHWTKTTSITYNKNNKNITISDNKEYTCITESRLIALKRQVSSYDDYGNVLPFILGVTKDNDGQIVDMQAEFCYMLGVTNEVLTDYTNGYGDEMVKMRYKPNSGTTWTDITNTGSLTVDDFSCDDGRLEFTYYIGCDFSFTYEDIPGVESEKNVIKTRKKYSGVKYVEEWLFTKTTDTYQIDGGEHTFQYLSIYPVNNNNSYYANGNVDINGKNPIYSVATYYGMGLKENQILYMPYYKDEDLLGVQDINTLEYDMQSGRYLTTINAHIERGTSAAFEKHNILGEVKTFSDLENYRNNFFNL